MPSFMERAWTYEDREFSFLGFLKLRKFLNNSTPGADDIAYIWQIERSK